MISGYAAKRLKKPIMQKIRGMTRMNSKTLPTANPMSSAISQMNDSDARTIGVPIQEKREPMDILNDDLFGFCGSYRIAIVEGLAPRIRDLISSR